MMMSSAAFAHRAVEHMIVTSDLLGELRVPVEEVIQFEKGLYGLPECRRFVLVQSDREGLYWLQSLEHGTLAFLLVDPFLFFEGYSVELSPAEHLELQVEEPSDVAILAIVTLPTDRQDSPTANLQGPLALNLRCRVAKQMAVENEVFGVRSPFDLSRPRGSG